jgi:uncharacterized protein (DUF433 family)
MKFNADAGTIDVENDVELISEGLPLFGVVWMNPARMSGAPCFYGTRVPIKNLFDYLRGGDSLETFLEDFEGVKHEHAIQLLDSVCYIGSVDGQSGSHHYKPSTQDANRDFR